MADIVEIALKRRAKLQDGVAKPDEFFQIVDELKRGVSNAAQAPSSALSPSPPNPPAATTADVGLSREEIYEARKLRDARQREKPPTEAGG